jgi:N-acetylmuramoyl-L-alanine amidase
MRCSERPRTYTVIICVMIVIMMGSILSVGFISDNPEAALKVVVIDAGHGGKDPGCQGRGGMREKDVNLDISLKLGKLIKEKMPDVKVLYTRKEDKFIELFERADIANRSHANLFVSIHANSGPSGFCGTETYCMGLDLSEKNLDVAKRENSAILLEKGHKQKYDNFNPNAPESYILFSLFQNVFLSNSLKLAGKIERNFSDDQRFSRGVKQSGFVVLYKTAMPSILIETGFLTDPEDEKYLGSPAGRAQVAYDIFCAIEDYKSELEK